MRPAVISRLRVLAAAPLLVLLFSAASPSDSRRYLDDIKALTTPVMEGRGNGAKGLSRAAHLIEQRFKSLRLEPAGAPPYFQPFPVITGAQHTSGNHLQVQTGNS